jgi:hypothetical protein
MAANNNNQVKKILLSGELFLEFLARLGAYELPKDAKVQDVTLDPTPNCISVLVNSESFPAIEAGDLFFYAPLMLPTGVTKEKLDETLAELKPDKPKKESKTDA